ncbi:hypothetical protein CQW23_24996 [Capsicum baccatum]|uniref:Uncharacterized protein n=1 Tax=Capsicum baccatum TaxID=33114 RepID=A0A2G2VWE1_CAPBA|nr:hypothetical protein CQW23_24996 [Capsicum baccatum]
MHVEVIKGLGFNQDSHGFWVEKNFDEYKYKMLARGLNQDSTFEFERKLNRPDRYDRNVTENTSKAIRKIDKIKVDREETHIAKRMKGKKAKEQREAAKELEQSIHLVPVPEKPPVTLPIKVPGLTQKQSEENRMEE